MMCRVINFWVRLFLTNNLRPIRKKMKKLVVAVVLVIIMMVGCSEAVVVVVEKNQIEIIQKSIEKAIKKDMNDPSSFQFLSLQITKRVKVGERKKFANEDTLNDLKNNPYSTQDFIDQVEAEMEHLKGKSDDEGAIIFVDYKIRGSNTFGGIVKEQYSIICLDDENSTVVSVKQRKI